MSPKISERERAEIDRRWRKEAGAAAEEADVLDGAIGTLEKELCFGGTKTGQDRRWPRFIEAQEVDWVLRMVVIRLEKDCVRDGLSN
jgi:hypothetical protein